MHKIFVILEVDIHTHSFSNESIAVKNVCLGVKNLLGERFSAGLHPWHISLFSDKKILNLIKSLSLKKSFVAVGETGLDVFAEADLSEQEIFFEEQLKMSESLDKPVILHCVRCYDKLLYFRKRYRQTPWIVHDFRGNSALAKQLLKSDIFLSFGRSLIYEHKKSVEAFTQIDLNRVFFETDTENFSIRDVYEKACEIRHIDYDELKSIIYSNFVKIFGV